LWALHKSFPLFTMREGWLLETALALSESQRENRGMKQTN
jgi:hypothetical protein